METFTCVFELLNDVCYMTDDYLLRQVYFDATWILIWTIIRLMFTIITGWITYLFWKHRIDLGEGVDMGFIIGILCLILFLSLPHGFEAALDRFILPEPYMYQLVQEGVKKAIE